MLPKILELVPQYRDYVWGGRRLRRGNAPTAEAWIVYDQDQIESGVGDGRTLADLTTEYGVALLGRRVVKRNGKKFPLLIKLLDCAEWLSVQVHPTDAQAVQLEGAGQSGKTEAWHVLEAGAKARLIAGLQPGVSRAEMEDAIRNGSIEKLSQYLDVHTGDTLLMPAGTIHALGPGLLVYEVQEASDITYRVYDWDRPKSEGRKLHIDQSLAVANPDLHPQAVPMPRLMDGRRTAVCRSDYFTLEVLSAETKTIDLDTDGETFHALTVIQGSALVSTGAEQKRLERFGTVLIPAATGAYQVKPLGSYQMLKSSVEKG